MRVIINKAERLLKIPQPVLGNMHFSRKRLEARHVNLIDLENFSPEMPDIRPFKAEIDKYSDGPSDRDQISRLKEMIVLRHQSLRNAELEPESEIVITPGIRFTATLICLGLLNPGDLAAHPDPGLQYFRAAISLADGSARKYSLLEGNDYIVNIPSLLSLSHKKLKILLINYPHNPTGTNVDFYFYRELLRSLRFKSVLTVADCAHIHPGNPDPSGPLQVKKGSGMAVELHTFSTTFGIPGLGFAAGHKDIISIIKTLLRSLGFAPEARRVRLAIAGLEQADDIFNSRMETLRRRREVLSEGLKKLDWRVRSGRLVPFIWVKPPIHGTSVNFARRLFVKAGIRVSPGSDFGESGEGWLRMTFSCPESVLTEALERLSGHSHIWQRKYRP